MHVNFTLTFSKTEWICYNDEVELKADSLESLDDHIEIYISENYPSGEYKVKMYFDFDRFPKWHRQYMPHYFNREFIFQNN